MKKNDLGASSSKEIDDRTKDEKSSVDMTRDQAKKKERLRELKNKVEKSTETFEKEKITKVQEMVSMAQAYAAIGEMIELKSDETHEKQQELLSQSLKDWPPRIWDHFCEASLKGHEKRKWALDMIHAKLDELADQQYKLKSLSGEDLVAFDEKHKSDNEMLWARQAVVRENDRRMVAALDQFLQLVNRGMKPESSQGN